MPPTVQRFRLRQALILICLANAWLSNAPRAQYGGSEADGEAWYEDAPHAAHRYRDEDLMPDDGWPHMPDGKFWHRAPPPAGHLSLGKEPAAPPPGPVPYGHRYWCANPAGYFPYIYACRAPWRSVSSETYR